MASEEYERKLKGQRKEELAEALRLLANRIEEAAEIEECKWTIENETADIPDRQYRTVRMTGRREIVFYIKWLECDRQIEE